MDIQEALKIAAPAIRAHRSTATFGGVGDKYHRPLHNQICHYEGKRGWSKEIQYYYTAIASETSQAGLEKLIAFAHWILSDTSPWAKITSGRKSEVIVENRTVGYILEVKPEDDLKWIINMSMVGRIPQERGTCWALMKDLLDHDVGFHDGVYLAEYFNKTSNGGVAPNGYNNYNHSIVAPRFSLKKFLESDPNPSKTPLVGGDLGGNWGRRDQDADGRGPINNTFSGSKKPEIKPLQDVVEMSGAIVGRWTRLEGGRKIENLVRVWNNGYRKEFLEACALAA